MAKFNQINKNEINKKIENREDLIINNIPIKNEELKNKSGLIQFRLNQTNYMAFQNYCKNFEVSMSSKSREILIEFLRDKNIIQ